MEVDPESAYQGDAIAFPNLGSDAEPLFGSDVGTSSVDRHGPTNPPLFVHYRGALADPHVDGESAVFECSRIACDRQHLMKEVAWKEHRGIVLGFDDTHLPLSIINGETATDELPRPCMEIINARQPPLPVRAAGRGITMLGERTTVVVCLTQQLNLTLLQRGSESLLEEWHESLEAAHEFHRWAQRGRHPIKRRSDRSVAPSRAKLRASVDHLPKHQFRAFFGKKISNAQVWDRASSA